MKLNKTTALYWSITLLFSAAMLLDGVGGVLHVEAGQEVMRHLGYPIYALSIFGAAKLLGAVALVQPWFRTIKEWAYAGFTINFLGAFASRAFVGDELSLLIPPLVALGILFVSYFSWKKVIRRKSGALVALPIPEIAPSQAA